MYMTEQFARTEILLGDEAMERLARARVAVFGIGGVGGYVCEALARSGVGELDLIDDDRVCLTNLNRQIIATHKTLGVIRRKSCGSGSWRSIRRPGYGSTGASSCRKMRRSSPLRSMIMWWMRWIP